MRPLISTCSKKVRVIWTLLFWQTGGSCCHSCQHTSLPIRDIRLEPALDPSGIIDVFLDSSAESSARLFIGNLHRELKTAKFRVLRCFCFITSLLVDTALQLLTRQTEEHKTRESA